MSKKVPIEAVKILADALQEFKDIVDEDFVLRDFMLVLGTHQDPALSVQITATMGEQDFDLAFE